MESDSKKGPVINIVTSRVDNRDHSSLKKVEGGFVGAQRFEKGEKSLNMPGRVIEEWIDQVLGEE